MNMADQDDPAPNRNEAKAMSDRIAKMLTESDIVPCLKFGRLEITITNGVIQQIVISQSFKPSSN